MRQRRFACSSPNLLIGVSKDGVPHFAKTRAAIGAILRRDPFYAKIFFPHGKCLPNLRFCCFLRPWRRYSFLFPSRFHERVALGRHSPDEINGMLFLWVNEEWRDRKPGYPLPPNAIDGNIVIGAANFIFSSLRIQAVTANISAAHGLG